MKYVSGSRSYINVNMKVKKTYQVLIRKKDSLENIKKKLRQHCKLRNSARLFYDGREMNANDTPENLGIEDGHHIEVYNNMIGGGGQIFLNEEGILDALNEDKNDTDKNETDTDKNETDTVESLLEDLNDDTNENSNSTPYKFELENTVENINPDMSEIETERNYGSEDLQGNNSEFINQLRQEYRDGKLLKSNNLHKKIICLLDLPTICPAELRRLKHLYETKLKHDEWNADKIEIVNSLKKTTKKRKLNNLKVERNMRKRSKIAIPDCIEENMHSPKYVSSKVTESRSLLTPKQRKQRKMLLAKLKTTTPSPLKRKDFVSEEEMRRFSATVHLFAELRLGSIRKLQDFRLKSKDFKDLIQFAGPGSKWNLLKGRSITVYKNLWRNMTKSKHVYRGHANTGFENDLKVHEPIAPFCPFEHCKTGIMSQMDLDLIIMTPPKLNSYVLDTKQIGTSSRRLFGSNSKNYQTEEFKSPEEGKTDAISEILEPITECGAGKTDFFENEKEHSGINEIFKCEISNCEFSFETTVGLRRHQRKVHNLEIFQNKAKYCKFCGKNIIFLDQHMRIVHKNLVGGTICDVCKKPVSGDIKKHRAICIKCLFCAKIIKKKQRLLKHMEICQEKENISNKDLSNVKNNPGHHIGLLNGPQSLTIYDSGLQGTSSTEQLLGGPVVVNPAMVTQAELLGSDQKTYCIDYTNKPVPLNVKRSSFPFDKEEDNEFYISELEDNDSEEFTRKRRYNKDEVEKELRNVDAMKNLQLAGDDAIENKFRSYMQQKKKRKNMKQVSTVEIYTKVVRNHILPAFHSLVNPFDARWLLDCKTPKDCKISGERRKFVKDEEPIYMTSTIVEEILKKIDAYGEESGSERGIILSAIINFLEFIELHFASKLDVYGPGPLEKLNPYHKGVTNFLAATGLWRKSNNEKDQAHHSNKVRESYEKPNNDIEILERYQEYLKSLGRQTDIEKVLKFSHKESPLPTDGEWTRLGHIVMGEIVMSTGKRPKVPRDLTVGAYVDKTPGFNPHEVSAGDCIIDEEKNNEKIFRRVNPNLPPKHLACIHQLKEKKAECPVMCVDRKDPDGYNIYVDWDKNQSSTGPSFLHLTKHIKSLMDAYDIIRTRFFQGRKSNISPSTNWLQEDNTPFFLNSAGSSFQFIDLKHIQEVMGLDVTSYSFRRIVTTWALSHESEMIRNAEEDALNHGAKIARDRYLQNKQSKPQMLTQKYKEQEHIFPKTVVEQIKITEKMSLSQLKETEERRTKQRYANIVSKDAEYAKARQENRPLGPRQRLLTSDRNRFRDMVEDLLKESIEISLRKFSPKMWRNFIIRLVFTADEPKGFELRKLWVKIYKGDLRWGVRDARRRALVQNQAINTRPDRNSWIAFCLRKSLKTDMSM